MKTKTAGFAALIMFLVTTTGIEAQNYKTVSGIVTTFQNYPLNNVKVSSKKSEKTVYTDSEGKFSVKCLNGDLLLISASGFERKEIRVKKKASYNVDMVYIDSESGFNRAISDNHISEADLRKAINEQMQAKQHDFSKYGSIYELVSSEVYNVRIKGNTIVNTKMRSFDPSPPVLLVVDDRIVSDISFLDPSWVRSVELIDDVRTTLYGSMGANGVLRIMLK